MSSRGEGPNPGEWWICGWEIPASGEPINEPYDPQQQVYVHKHKRIRAGFRFVDGELMWFQEYVT